jgi:hypothetical protein
MSRRIPITRPRLKPMPPKSNGNQSGGGADSKDNPIYQTMQDSHFKPMPKWLQHLYSLTPNGFFSHNTRQTSIGFNGDFFNLKQGFSNPNIIGVPTNIIHSNNFVNFDYGDIYTPEIAQAYRQGLAMPLLPKLKAKGLVPNPKVLMLSPDASGGDGMGGIVGQGWVKTVSGSDYKLSENIVYNFVIDSSVLPNGYKVGGILDKNQYQINKNKSPVTINQQFSGKWIKFYPTLMHLGYQIINRWGVISITSPSNLVGYEVPLVFVKKV